MVHRDLRPLFVSEGYAQVHGFDSVDKILELESLESLYAGQAKPQLFGLEKARRDGHPTAEIFEYDGRARDGRVIPLLCSASLVDWDGALAIQQTVTDLSDIRTSRRSLETRLQKLDHQVQLRTEELGNLRDLMFADTSMRERFENASGHSEQRLRAVADHVPADITLKDLDGRYILVNREFVRKMGVSESEILNKTATDVFVKKRAELYDRVERDVIQSNRVIMVEEALDDGSIHDLIKFPIFDLAGEINGIGSIGIEVTENRTAQERMRESETRYRALFEQTPIGLWEEDWSGAKELLDQLASHERENLLGYFEDHPAFLQKLASRIKVINVNQTTLDLYSSVNREQLLLDINQDLRDTPSPKLAERLAAFASGARRSSTEGWESRFSGGVYFLRITMAIPDGHENDWSLVIGSAQDFTDRNLAREKEQAYANLLENIRRLQSDYIAEVPEPSVFDGLVSRLLALTDSEFGFIGKVLINHDATPYLEIQAVSKTTRFGGGGIDADIARRLELHNQDTLFAHAIATGKPVISNQPAEDWGADTMLSESLRFRSFLAVPLYRGDELVGLAGFADRPTGYDQSLVDFLDPLLTTAAHIIDAYRSSAQRQRAEKGKTLLAAQLRQSQKMEAVGHLTGGIAHDFNNILASVLGYAGLAHDRSRRNGDEKVSRYLQEVVRAGERARDLVGQMLTFSRSGSGDPRPLNLTLDLEEEIRMLRATFPSTVGLQLLVADTDIPNVICDPVHLYQAVMNVCINARDAIQEKGSIIVSLTRTDVGPKHCDACRQQFSGDFVEITVSDTGVGISDQVRQRVFDPFFTTKDVGKGSGMGLSVVHGIIHQYQGHIVLESSPGAGTLVRMFVPPAPETAYEAQSVKPGKTSLDSAVERGRILVVDDEPSVAAFLGELLELRGYSVQTLTSSREAWSWLSKHADTIDLLVTDQTMPDLTGKELIEKARVLNRDLPVVICTGYSEQVDRHLVESWTNSAYLEKPIQIDRLLRSIKDLISSTAKEGLE